MPVAEVVTKNEVMLGGTRFPTDGPPRRVLVSLKAPRISIGSEQTNEESRASQATITSALGGIGRERGMDSTNIDQVFWSTCNIEFDRHLTLPRLAFQTAVIKSGVVADIGFVAEYSGTDKMYAEFGLDIYEYNNTTNVWTSVHTVPSPVTDWIEVRIGGTQYLIVAHTSGYSYTVNGTSWTDKTTDVKYFTLWQDVVYAIDNTGLLKFATDITSGASGAWTPDAQLVAPNGYVSKLFTAPDVSDNEVIYLTAKNGLWQHDDSGTRFRRSRFKTPFHPHFGTGVDVWRDSIYMSAGTAVHRYFVSGNAATVNTMGPDQRHGLPNDKRGVIRHLLSSYNHLIALMDSTLQPTTAYAIQMGRKSNWGGHRSMVIRSDVGFSPILLYNEVGWSVGWLGDETGRAITAASISNTYGEYRLWWGVNGRVWWQPLSIDLINPDQITGFEYALAAEHITSWLDAGDIINPKVALTLAVHTQGCSSTETVKVYAGYDLDATWNLLETITTNGITLIVFRDDNSDPAGKEWTHIRFKHELARGTTSTTVSPDVTFVQFRWQQNLGPKWGNQITINLQKEYKGLSPKELADILFDIVATKTLIQYQARPETEDAEWVNVENAAGWEETGQKYDGQMTVNVIEP